MFKVRTKYKHNNNTDVAMEVQKVLGNTDDGISLLVSWWNIKSKIQHKIVRYQAVVIKNVEIVNWLEGI